MKTTMKMLRRVLLCCTCLLMYQSIEAQVMKDVATSHTLPNNAPKYSDVVMRSLKFRDETFQHGSTLQNAKDFHVTRLDWVYVDEMHNGNRTDAEIQNFMDQFANEGIDVGATINATPFDQSIAIEDENGNPAGVPWLSNRYFICHNKPGAYDYNLDNIKKAIDFGAIAIQRDEPGYGNIERWDNGYCFCSYCQAEANNEGVNLNVDSERKTFNFESTWEFYDQLHADADAYAGFQVAMSCNGGSRSWNDNDYEEVFDRHDYRNSELHGSDPSEMYDLSVETRARDKVQIFQYTSGSDMTEITQKRHIALSYATGMNVMVPWDVYINSNPRYFGIPEDFADIFGFVRALGQEGYLDGYQDAAVGGYDLNENRYGTDPLGIVSGNSNVSMFARAKPGDADAPVMVHLVEWSGSGNTTVRLRTDNFFNGASLNIKLWTIKGYNESEHDNAESSGDYSSLKWDRTGDITVTVNGDWTEVNIPDLDPWGVLVVEKGSGGGGGGTTSVSIEAESTSGQSMFAPFEVVNGTPTYVEVPNGTGNVTGGFTDGTSGQMHFDFNLTASSDVIVQCRVLAVNSSDDSFYFKMDDGSWETWHVPKDSDWQLLTWKTYSGLSSGDHTLKIGRREDGTKLDHIRLSVTNGSISAGNGGGGTSPNAPGGLNASDVSSSQINLSWSDNSNDEDGFKIERKSGNGSFSQITTVGNDVTSYNDSGLTASTTYTYRVRAYNSSGNSNYSNEAAATTQNSGGGGGDPTDYVARFSLDNNANDATGSHNGTIQNGNDFSSSDVQEGSHSYIADGNNNYIEVSDHNDLDLGTSDFTISAWVQRDDNSTTNLRVFSKGAGYDGASGYAVWGSNSGFSAAIGDGSSRIIVGGNSHNGVGAWTHLTVTYDRDSDLTVYIDGVESNSSSISSMSSDNINNNDNFNIGRNSTSGAHNWDGKIDDVRIYRRALSATEVQDLYDAYGSSGGGGSSLTFEAGTITNNQSNSSTWYTQNLTNNYSNPVVVLGPPTFNGSQPEVVRTRNISGSSFEYQQDEWDYLDGGHTTEDIGYLVMESGTHTLGGLDAEADIVSNVSTSFQTVNFSQNFSTSPIILATVASVNENSAVTIRIQNVSSSGFEVRVQEEEAGGSHAGETVHYVAIEPGSGSEGGSALVVGNSGNNVTENWSTVSYGTVSSPVFIASMQTTDGLDACALRMRNLSSSSAEVFVEEETSNDTELGHTTEDVGYLVIQTGSASSRIAGEAPQRSTIVQQTADELFVVYPNPSTGTITIESDTEGKIVVTDLLGKQVVVQQIEQDQITIDLSKRGKGIYLVRMGDAVRKVVIR